MLATPVVDISLEQAQSLNIDSDLQGQIDDFFPIFRERAQTANAANDEIATAIFELVGQVSTFALHSSKRRDVFGPRMIAGDMRSGNRRRFRSRALRDA